jgi:hypothetical protein
MGFFGKHFQASWAKKKSQKSEAATCVRRPALVPLWQLTQRTPRLQPPPAKMRRQRGTKPMADPEAIGVTHLPLPMPAVCLSIAWSSRS